MRIEWWALWSLPEHWSQWSLPLSSPKASDAKPPWYPPCDLFSKTTICCVSLTCLQYHTQAHFDASFPGSTERAMGPSWSSPPSDHALYHQHPHPHQSISLNASCHPSTEAFPNLWNPSGLLLHHMTSSPTSQKIQSDPFLLPLFLFRDQGKITFKFLSFVCFSPSSSAH